MLITDEQLFCEELRTDIPELANIGETCKVKGLKQEKLLLYSVWICCYNADKLAGSRGVCTVACPFCKKYKLEGI